EMLGRQQKRRFVELHEDTDTNPSGPSTPAKAREELHTNLPFLPEIPPSTTSFSIPAPPILQRQESLAQRINLPFPILDPSEAAARTSLALQPYANSTLPSSSSRKRPAYGLGLARRTSTTYGNRNAIPRLGIDNASERGNMLSTSARPRGRVVIFPKQIQVLLVPLLNGGDIGRYALQYVRPRVNTAEMMRIDSRNLLRWTHLNGSSEDAVRQAVQLSFSDILKQEPF